MTLGTTSVHEKYVMTEEGKNDYQKEETLKLQLTFTAFLKSMVEEKKKKIFTTVR